MNLLKKLTLALFVCAFVACSSDDDNEPNYPSESQIPTSSEDVTPETSGEESGIQEGSYSLVGYWEGTGYIENGENYPIVEGECGDYLAFDNDGVMVTEYYHNGTSCVEDGSIFGAYNRDGEKLYVLIDGETETLTIEVTETTLKLSGEDEEGTWTDIFTRVE